MVFCLGYLVAPLGSSMLHVDLMRSALILFPHGVAIAYVSSLSKRKNLYKYHLLSLPSLALPFSYDVVRYYLPVISAYMIFVSISSARDWKGPFKRSLQLVALSYFGLAMYSVTPSTNVFVDGLKLLTYPLTLIYAVSGQSFPKTFGEGANWALLFASSILTFSLLSYPLVLSKLTLVALVLYLISIKLYRFKDFWSKVKAMSNNEVAYKANEYFLLGHLWVAASVPAAFAYFHSPLALLHALVLGFVALHIFVHFPLMVPIILEIRNKRRYNQAPFALTLPAAYLWPLLKHLAWALLALGFLSLISIIA